MTQLLPAPTSPPAAAAPRGALAPPAPGPRELAATLQLRALLDECSWPHLHLYVGHGEPFAAEPARALAAVEELPALPRRLLRLLGLGLPVPDDGAPPESRAAEAALLDAGLLTRGGGALRTTGWVVAPALGGEVIMGTPSTYISGGSVGALAYLGSDSLLLAKLLGPLQGRSFLDLGAGCGAQGLLTARGAARAVLTDIDAFSLRVSALNWALNAVEHPVLLGEGDLYAPLAGERVDVIAVLPPYLPSFPEAGVSVTAAGGLDGLTFIRRLLAGAGEALNPGGELVALAQLQCDDDGPLLERELAELAPELAVQLVLFDRHPLQPYLAELSGRLVRHGSAVEPRALAARFEATLRSRGVTGVCTAAIRGRRVTGGGATRVLGPPGALLSRDVLAPAPGVTTGRAGGQASLAGAGLPAMPLDPVTAALVAALDGERTIAAAAARAWGAPVGATPQQLAEQAALRLGDLFGRGYLVRCAVR
ncbi:MAG TPA: methyltransferase [Acidimicrobiales bacterium]|nr:methyltransferase [Acidimicrobiales bacterium]